MNDSSPSSQIARPRQPAWNKGKLTGPKPPLRPGHVWSIRAKLQLERRTRDLAVAPNRYAVDRATIRQRKTGRPVRFELTEVTRQALDDYLRESGRTVGQFLFPGRRRDQSLTTRQYARLVSLWISGIGLDRLKYATHFMRRTKAKLIYRRTGNLRAVQLLLGHQKNQSTVRYLGVEVDDALEISEDRGLNYRGRELPRSARGRLRSAHAEPVADPRSGPKHAQHMKALFDHLVGAGEQGRRHRDAERLGSFQIDNQIEGRWLLYWQFGRLLAAENTAGVNTDLAIDVRNADTIAHQATCHSEFTTMVDCRQRVRSCQSNKLVTSSVE